MCVNLTSSDRTDGQSRPRPDSSAPPLVRYACT